MKKTTQELVIYLKIDIVIGAKKIEKFKKNIC